MDNAKHANEIVAHIAYARQRALTATKIVQALDVKDAEISRLIAAVAEAQADAIALIREDVYAAKKLYDQAVLYDQHCDKCL
jgi:plasmid maintenance system antidote protein VapI